MARLECSRDAIGAVRDPDTGDLVQLNESHSRELAERVAAAHDHVSLADEETENVAPDTDDSAPSEEEDAEAETFRCGVNDCSRTVNSESATCWQH